MPKLGIDDSRPALARSSPRSVCRVGMRNAAPLMNTFAHSVAVNAMTSIDQRRSVLIDSTDMCPSSHSDLSILNRLLIYVRRHAVGSGAARRVTAATRLRRCV